MKRLLDLFLSSIALVLLSPLFLVIAILIKRESSGPVFYRGTRVGRLGKPFRIYKFRTMVANADQVGGPNTPADDPRITGLGRKMRRFNLDELPQFINVVAGDMSIVGPRPEVSEYVALFTEEEKAILRVRPGITDPATLWIRDEGAILAGSSDPEKTYMEEIWPEKHRLELDYVNNRSVWLDLKVMFLTLKSHLIDRFRSRA